MYSNVKSSVRVPCKILVINVLLLIQRMFLYFMNSKLCIFMTQPLTRLLSAGLGHRTPGCGISDSVQSWMDEVRYSGEKTELPPPKVVAQPPVQDDDIDLGPQYKYSLEANDPSRSSSSRVKRSLPNPNSKKSCALYIQTDPLFWKHIREQVRSTHN